MLRRRWRLAAVFCLVAGIGGLVHYFVTPRMYKATTTIQIDRRTLSLGASADTPWVENWYNLEFYPTQYKLLESRGLAERVVTDLRLYEDPSSTPRGASWGGRKGSATPVSTPPARRHGRAAARRLEIAPIKNTQLVAINYRSSSPELAARIANGVAESFIDGGIEDRSTSAGKASNFLGKQIESLKQEISNKERRCRGTAGAPTSSPSTPTPTRRCSAAGAQQQLHRGGVGRIEKEAAYNQSVNAPAETIADSISGGLVSTQRQELLAMRQDYNAKRSTTSPTCR